MDRLTAAQVYVAITERGSLAGAAHTLDMSRAMVTRYLAQMEAWAGARLLHRSTRRLGMTTAGEETLARCRRLLAVAGQMPVATGTQEDLPRGMLRMACSQSLAQVALAPAITGYLARHPHTAVDLHIGNHAVNLVEDRIDLAIRITNQLDPGLITRPLAVCASVVCAAPAYLSSRGTPRDAADLAAHNCLAYTHFGKSLWQFELRGAPVAVAVGGNLTANDSAVLLAATAAGAGVSLQPLYMAAPLIANGQLVALLPEYRPQELGIHALYTSRQHMPATLRTMLDFLVEWFEREALWAGGDGLATRAARRA